MNLKPVFIREKVIHAVRTFFYDQHFHEVITPTFNAALPIEPNIYAFETSWNTIRGNKKLYLSTSPESGLKKMIANGIGNCYAIGKSFRNLEAAGKTHIPEFLMLEWYRENALYTQIMDDTEKLVRFIFSHINESLDNSGPLTYQNNSISLLSPWPRYTLTYLFEKYAHLSLDEILDDSAMKKQAAAKGYDTRDANWEQLFNQIFLNEIEPFLGMNPCFVVDFPARTSPLCTPKPEDPRLSQRFEIYIAGMELGNGNTENTDTTSIKKVFQQEQEYRQENDILVPSLDDQLLKALETMKSKSYAGIGLGIDRLAMIMANTTEINDVEPLVLSIC